jgi:TPR repeat protein
MGKMSYQEGDLEEAERYFRESADAGLLASMFALGVVLQERGLSDQAEAAYRAAADREHAQARAYLGALLDERGESSEAEFLYQAAAGAGSAEGQYRLGMRRLEEGLPFEGERLLRDAAKQWHPGAARFLVDMLIKENRATEQDLQEASAAAYVEGGRLLQQKRDREAEDWLRYGADHGHSGAMFELSNLLSRHGNVAEAQTYFDQAVRLGHPLATLFKEFERKINRSQPSPRDQ